MIAKAWKMWDTSLPLIFSRVQEKRTASLETLALTMVIPAFGFGLNPDDPFFLNNKFPWLIVAPLLVSHRYGFIFGISSTSALICFITLSRYFHWIVLPDFPAEQVVGMLLITLISAEYQDLWQRKIQALQNKCDYLTLRMNEFARTYHVLKGSHSQLEQQTAIYAKSMRASLLDLEIQMQALAKHEGEPLIGIGDYILKLFSEYGNIQTASLYPVLEGQKLSLHPISCLGIPPTIWPSNPLVRQALKTGHVTSIKNFEEEVGHEILVVIPLIDVYQKIWGMVVVNEMPMFALQENTLDLLSLLGGHIGDLVQQRVESNLLSKDAWQEFEYGLRRVLRDMQDSKIHAGLVVNITGCIKKHDELMTKYRLELRGLDKVFSFVDSSGRMVIINLLPLTDEKGLSDFLLRLGLLQCRVNPQLFGHVGNGGNPTTNEDIVIYSWILNAADSPDKVLSEIGHLCQRKISSDSKGDFLRAETSA